MAEYVVPLGVSAAVPYAGRHFASVALVSEAYVVLFDCGEGTQFRLIDAGIRFSRIRVIAVTHLHGDHYLGLPGLLSTMSMQHRTEPLYLVGPAALEDVLASVPGIGRDRRPFELIFKGIGDRFTGGELLRWPQASRQPRSPHFVLSAAQLEHGVPAFGYRLQEGERPGHLDAEAARALGVTDHADYRRLKDGDAVITASGAKVEPEQVVSDSTPGPSMAYVSDTRPCEAGVQLARDVDLLYHEATFLERDVDRALRTGHTTAREAGEVAAKAGCRRLLLGHFSARYEDPAALAKEASTVFPRVDAAQELVRYYLDGSDAGGTDGTESEEGAT